VEFFVVHWR